MPARHNFAGGLVDRTGYAGVEPVLAVHPGRGLLDDRKRMNDADWHAFSWPEGKILDAALGLSAPIDLGWDLYRPHTVYFSAGLSHEISVNGCTRLAVSDSFGASHSAPPSHAVSKKIKSGHIAAPAALNVFHHQKVSAMCHVLIIEDEPLIAMDLEQILQNEGATSFAFAASEDQAVAAAMERRPDVITSDVKLDVGTGPHAIKTIHTRLGVIPVIFITGTPAECEPCEPPGVVLSKPVNARAVISAFHRLQL